MKITGIEIWNFRGIRHANVNFPLTSRLSCLIGPGDSGKTSLLKAIEWALWPSYNLNVTDTDFYDCNTSEEIRITVSITEIPESLIKEDRYGLFLRDYYKALHNYDDDEPTDIGIVILSIRLIVDSSLEPKWEVITNRMEPRAISQKDRRSLFLGVVGFDYDKDFQWGRTSVLQKYVDSTDALHDAFTQAMRNAVANTHLETLDSIVPALTAVGGMYGVSFAGEIKNKLIMQNGSYSTSVGIFDEKVPIFQRGIGSKRLLSIGMNINSYNDGTVVLIDEIETGLEPYRISSLIRELRSQFSDKGQLIATTHSASAVCECNADEIMVCYNNDGEFAAKNPNDMEINDDIQRLLRAYPEAFLSKRIIVGEGKTEVGFLRAFDSFLACKKRARLAHYGVSYVPGGGGDKFFKLAECLHGCGYDVSILMDSDVPAEEATKAQMRSQGIPVFDWEQGFSIEQQLFHDLSVELINAMISLVVEQKSIDHVKNKLDSVFGLESRPYVVSDDTITIDDIISIEDRNTLGSISKKSEWFKSITMGQMVGKIVFDPSVALQDCRLKETIDEIYRWATSDESRRNSTDCVKA